MATIKLFFKKHWFGVGVIFIFFVAFFLRFYNFENRWILAYDQAHDALIARYALSSLQIPLVGPFSSGGPFQTGGQWYWFIMIGTFLFGKLLVAPWIFLSLVYVIFTIVMVYLGKVLINKQFGLILGLLSAVSTSQVSQSVNLANQSPIPILSAIGLLFTTLYIKNKKNRYLFFLSMSFALAPTIHMQGILLLLIIPITLLIAKSFNKEKLLTAIAGIFIALLPLIIFDIQNNFINFRSMLNYYLVDQYKIPFESLGRRWLTYLSDFWPESWAFIIGGSKIISYLIISLSIFIGIYSILKKKLSREWFVIFLSFVLMVIAVRYVRTPIFASYLMFLNPFVLLVTGWVIYKLSKMNAFLGIFILIFILVVSLNKSYAYINIKDSGSIPNRAKHWKNLLVKSYPGKKFAIYDYKYKSATYSLPLVLYLDAEGILDTNGYKIGFGESDKFSLNYKKIEGNKMGFDLWDINSSSSGEIKKMEWIFVGPEAIYDSTENWNKK